jgi:hypothetical protein
MEEGMEKGTRVVFQVHGEIYKLSMNLDAVVDTGDEVLIYENGMKVGWFNKTYLECWYIDDDEKINALKE